MPDSKRNMADAVDEVQFQQVRLVWKCFVRELC